MLRTALWLSLATLGLSVEMRPVEIVLAHCKEDISWLDNFNYGPIATVYDKCGVDTGPGNHIPKPNIGREGGTYLQHIVDRYETLADWTVFTQGESPTYGYKGHRLGGGHMMSNTKFEDYVQAAAHRHEQPLFFVYTTILVLSDNTLFQCIRQGYGNGYTPLPETASLQQQTCGAIEEWTQWFEFPDWFKSLVIKLQGLQMAPLAEFNLERTLEVFGIQPSDGVMFFAQGARFAVSREQIQSRPKSYYEQLLRHMQHPDPWAGYFLEWLWWYVLNGSPAPCGYEATVARQHYAWRGLPLPQRKVRTLSVSGDTANDLVTYSNTSVTGTKTYTVTGSQNFVFSSGTFTTVSGTLTITSTGSGEVRMDQGSTINVTGTLVISATTVVLNGATFNIQAGASCNITSSSGTITMTSLQAFFAATVTISGVAAIESSDIEIASGGKMKMKNGNVNMKKCKLHGSGDLISEVEGAADDTRRYNRDGGGGTSKVRVENSTVSTPLTAKGKKFGSKRRTDLTNYQVVELCNAAQGDISLDAASALQLYLNCTLSSTYSNTITSLTYSSGAIIALLQVSSTSKPTLISSLSSPAGLKYEVVNVGTGTYSVPVIVYGPSGSSCSSTLSTSVDGCQSDATCTVTSTTYSADTSLCSIVFTQTAGSSSSSTNNPALFALFALLAIIPIVALIAWLGYIYYVKPVPTNNGATEGYGGRSPASNKNAVASPVNSQIYASTAAVAAAPAVAFSAGSYSVPPSPSGYSIGPKGLQYSPAFSGYGQASPTPTPTTLGTAQFTAPPMSPGNFFSPAYPQP